MTSQQINLKRLRLKLGEERLPDGKAIASESVRVRVHSGERDKEMNDVWADAAQGRRSCRRAADFQMDGSVGCS